MILSVQLLMCAQVKDLHCPGTVLTDDATFEVDFKARPKVFLQETAGIVKHHGIYRHKGLCAGEEDQVVLRFEGESSGDTR
jgi:nucleoporin POM152